MDSKLSQGDVNVDNNCNYYTEIPSYQMQTISSCLKIVVKDDLRKEEREGAGAGQVVPFTVGSAFITHNVKLLKQETLQKLKSVMLSYRNENEINRSNITELRLLKNDIDSYRVESQNLKLFASRRRHLLKAVNSRYMYFPGKNEFRRVPVSVRKEKLNVQRNESNSEAELVDLFKLRNHLETMFRNNKSNNDLRKKSVAEAHNPRIATEIGKPTEKVKHFLQHDVFNDETMYPLTTETSTTSINRKSISGKSKKIKRRKRYTSGDVPREEEEYVTDQSEQMRDKEITLMDMSAQLSGIHFQEQEDRCVAPSIYSRKKKHRHVRKYVAAEVDDIPEHNGNRLEIVTSDNIVKEADEYSEDDV